MINKEENQKKISYLKQLEECVRNKVLDKQQKELKNMRMYVDSLVKNLGKRKVEVEESLKQVVTAEKPTNLTNKSKDESVKKDNFEKVERSEKKDFIKQDKVEFSNRTEFGKDKFQNKFNDKFRNGERSERPFNNDRFKGNERFNSKDKNGFNRENRFGRENNFNKDNTFRRDFNFKERRFDNKLGYNKFNKEGSNFRKPQNGDRATINEFRRSAEALSVNIDNSKNKFANKSGKKKFNKEFDDEITLKKGNKRTYDEDDIFFEDTSSNKKRVEKQENTIKKAVMETERITVKDYSVLIGKTVAEIVKKLLLLGVMSNINSYIDFDTASLIAEEFGIELEKNVAKTAEDIMFDARDFEDKEEDLVPRPPVITVMGHVDHGKTSLLDAIRKTKVASGEAGGITQHIGAYTITKDNRQITFIDTPGHEAFTAMRARGVKITDIAILVVAADDGVKPQTIEAIQHIKNANVPMIVAVNKMDVPQANIEKVKNQLAEFNVLPEEWGGDTIIVPISAKTGEGIDKLLDMMLLVADMENLRANPNREASAVVIESKLDRGRGPVATLLIQNGTLKIGNTIVCGTTMGKIRAMVDYNGKNVVSAKPSYAVEVLGFGEVPKAGELAQVVDEKLAKQIIQERKTKEQIDLANSGSALKIEDILNRKKKDANLNLIIKTDVQGSLEAIEQSISQIKNDEVEVSCIYGGVGNVTENDVSLAVTANAKIIAFNVKAEPSASKLADKEKIEIKNYKIIYDMLDDINDAVKALVKPKYKQVFTGSAEVRMIYKITGAGLIAGCFVKNGSIKRGSIAKIVRNGEIVCETEIESLKKFKDDAREVTEGFECGIKLKDTSFKEGDIIEAYENVEIKG